MLLIQPGCDKKHLVSQNKNRRLRHRWSKQLVWKWPWNLLNTVTMRVAPQNQRLNSSRKECTDCKYVGCKWFNERQPGNKKQVISKRKFYWLQLIKMSEIFDTILMYDPINLLFCCFACLGPVYDTNWTWEGIYGMVLRAIIARGGSGDQKLVWWR